jgi:hypothetical protein
MKKLVYLAVAVLGVFILSAYGQKAPNDLPKGHWAYDAVMYLLEKGYLVGYPDGTFRGDQPLTRYELALALYRLLMSNPALLLQAPPQDYNVLRGLLEEFRNEMTTIDQEKANDGGVGKEGGANPSSVLQELSSQVDELAKKLDERLALLPDPAAFADLAATVLDLKGRVDDLLQGVLPPRLLQAVADAASQAVEPKLRSLESRLSALEREVASLKEGLDRANQEVKAAQEVAQKGYQEAIQQIADLKKSLPRQEFGLQIGYALGTLEPRVPGGFYTSTYYGSYLPEGDLSYRLVLGQAPGTLYAGATLSLGEDPAKAFGTKIQAVASVNGGFGAGVATTGSLGSGAFGLEAGFQTSSFPKGVLADINGARLWVRGDMGDIRLQAEGSYGVTAPGADVPGAIATPVEGASCSRALLQGKGALQMPFLGFALLGMGAYHSETPANTTCTEPPITLTSYEVGLAHLADSPRALVPNLYLYAYYGGYNGEVGGSPIGLSYFGGRGSYSFALGQALALLVGGEYKSLSPSGAQASLKEAYRMGVYPYGNATYVAGKVRGVFNPSGDLRFSIEASYERIASLLTSVNLTFSPGLEVTAQDLAFALRLQYALLGNWNPLLPNPQAPVGRGDALSLAIEGKGYGFSITGSLYLSPTVNAKLLASYGLRW